jgi:hypothetical protein
MSQRRLIDDFRDSACSIEIKDDENAIVDLIPIGDALYTVTGHNIHCLQLADQIDPNRTKVAIPNTHQRVLAVGSDDPIVARTLLTAHTLFKKTFLGPGFEQEKGLTLALGILKDALAMVDMHARLKNAEQQAVAACDLKTQKDGSVQMPSIGNAGDRCDAFAHKACHLVKKIEDIVMLFYGDEITSKWVDSLATLTMRRYGADSSFAH